MYISLFANGIFSLALLIFSVQAAWEDPPVELVPGGLDGISYSFENGGHVIKIIENVGKDEGGGFSLVQLRLTDNSDEVKVEAGADSRFYVEKEDNGDGNEKWYFKVSGPFDYESENSDFGDPYFPVTLNQDGVRKTLIVLVLDENDNKPRVVSQDPDPIPPVPELKLKDDEPIVTINAVDDDKADNGNLTYEIENDAENEYFRVDKEGKVWMKKELEYIKQTSHRLNIKISDQRPPFLFVVTYVTIFVEDVPNLPPEFTKPPMIRAVVEHTLPGSLVFTVEARDGDYEVNWPIIYEITDDTLDLFSINEDTGAITIKNVIDADDDSLRQDLSYSFTVVAREDYNKAAYPDLTPEQTEISVDVSFAITDINDQKPIICDNDGVSFESCLETQQYSFQIREDFTGQIALQDDRIIRVKDLDPTTYFNRFTASFADGTEEIITKAFSINPTKGMDEQEFLIFVNDLAAIDFENGQWHDENGSPITRTFTIEFTGTNDTSHRATAVIHATVIDANDERPSFELPDGKTQYEFSVCENTKDGEVLHHIIPGSQYPNSCRDSTESDPIVVSAKDGDISPSFGTSSIIYRWTEGSSAPPIELDPKTGSMKMKLEESDAGFDYERLKVEVFTVEAVDMEGNGDSDNAVLSTTVPVRFTILDRNDEMVDLKVDSYRGSVEENSTDARIYPALSGIKATDKDETGKIEFSMTVLTAFVKANDNGNSSSLFLKYQPLEMKDELEKMKDWFELRESDGGSDNSKEFEIFVGKELPDREGYGIRDIDRVDLRIQVEDVNSETGKQIVFQDVSILINDTNDNPPEHSNKDDSNGVEVNVLETSFPKEEDDQSSDHQREIYRLSVFDKDLNPTFKFSLSSQDCGVKDEAVCQDILDMFELSVTESNSGFTALRRKRGMQIDRENRTLFPDNNSDILTITVITSDGKSEHELPTKFLITVDDINDNTPVFDTEEYCAPSCIVKEDANSTVEIVKIHATDEDHPALYGKVNYIFPDGENNAKGKFNVDLDSGVVTANGPYTWPQDQDFRFEAQAIDYYRPFSSSGSNKNSTWITIEVIDINDHPPTFETSGGNVEHPFLTVGESLGSGVKLSTIVIEDLDNPDLDNGKIQVKIENLEKLPTYSYPLSDDIFKLELTDGDRPQRKNCNLMSVKELKGLWGDYVLTLQAYDGEKSDPKQLCSDLGQFHIKITNDNLNPPEFIYPANNNTEFRISIDSAEPNKTLEDMSTGELLPKIHATDKDEGSGLNGEVHYSLEPSSTSGCLELFQINPEDKMAVITLKTKLREEDANRRCRMVIRARDASSSPKSEYRLIEFILLWNYNTPPVFSEPLYQVELLENSTDAVSEPFDRATDIDIENDNPLWENDTIHYFLKGGASNLFQLIEGEEDDKILRLEPKQGVTIDREETEYLMVSIYCTNDPTENPDDRDPEDIIANRGSTQWAVVNITVIDQLDTPPEFIGISTDGYITGGFSTSKRTGDEIAIIEAIDRDANDNFTFHIISDFETTDPSLPKPNATSRPIFELQQEENSKNASLILLFDPQPKFKGHYIFTVQVRDTVNMTAEAEIKIYVVSSVNSLNFYFGNDLSFLKEHQVTLASILTASFNYSCNIDRVFDNAAVNDESRTVETHFINTLTNEPVRGDFIKAQQFKPVFYIELTEKLAKENFKLRRIGESDPIPESNMGEIITFVLVGAVAVLVIVLLILATTCYYNNRGLHRKVRALTANTFGSQQSDLNRIGTNNTVAPNTNAFAVEGSNPIWTTDSEIKKTPDFDTESVGSGGSVLIGAEDEDYFKKSSKNPMFQSEDIVANYDSDNDVSFKEEEMYPNESYYNDPNAANPSENNTGQSPFVSRTSRNPLMNFDGEQASVEDVEDYGDESYQFEGNTDANLF